jgi:hypothetical protein
VSVIGPHLTDVRTLPLSSSSTRTRTWRGTKARCESRPIATTRRSPELCPLSRAASATQSSTSSTRVIGPEVVFTVIGA